MRTNRAGSEPPLSYSSYRQEGWGRGQRNPPPPVPHRPWLGSTPTLLLVSLQRGTAVLHRPRHLIKGPTECYQLQRSRWHSGCAWAPQPGPGQTYAHDLILTRTVYPAGAPAFPLTLLARDPGPAQGGTSGHPALTPGLESEVVTAPCQGPFGGKIVVSCPQLPRDVLCNRD